MKRTGLLALAGLLAWANALAQAPANDDCSTATVITPQAVQGCTPVLVNVGQATISVPPFSSSNQCGLTSVSSRDIWYQFTPTQTRHRLILQFSANGRQSAYELFSGTCGNLSSIACGSSSAQGTFHFYNLENLVVGQTYYIRTLLLLVGQNDQLGACIADPVRGPRRVISTTRGGTWTQAATWVGNEVPIDGDTVTVDDGATVLVPSNLVTSLRRLEIGRGLANNPAKLSFQAPTGGPNPGPIANTISISLSGDLVVNQAKDSLVIAAQLATRTAISLRGNWIHNGGLRYIATNNYNGTDIRFEGLGNSTVTGTGSFSNGMANLYIQKTGTVNWTIPMRLLGRLTLQDGFLQLPSGFGVARPRLALGGFYPGPEVQRTKGKLIGVLADTNNYNYLNISYSDPTGTVGGTPFDSSIVAGSEFVSGQLFNRLTVNRSTSNATLPVVFLGKILTRNLTYNNTRIVALDSVIVTGNLQCNSNPVDTLTYLDAPILRFYLARNDFTDMAIGRQGIKRHVDFTESGSVAPGGWVDVEFMPGKPFALAQYNLPLLNYLGSSFVRISSPASQALTALVELTWNLKDTISTPVTDMSLGVGPTTLGPFSSVGSLQTGITTLQTQQAQSLNTSQYYILATLGRVADIAVEQVLFPPPFLNGCARPQTLGVVVRNTGTEPIPTYVVSYRNGAVVRSQNVSPLVSLAVQRTDTVFFTGTDGVFVPLTGSVSVVASAQAALDVRSDNDSLVVSQSYDSPLVPYRQNFDTLTANAATTPTSSWISGWSFYNSRAAFNNYLGFVPITTTGGAKVLGLSNIISNPAARFEAYTPSFTVPTNSVGLVRVALQYTFSNLQAGDTLWVDVVRSCGDTVQNLRTFTRANAPVAPTNTLEFAEVVPGEPFYLRFKAVTARIAAPGNRQMLVDNLVIDQPANGLADGLGKAALKLYPNPAGAQLTLESQEAGQLFLLDLQGRVVRTHTLSDVGTTTLSVGDMPAGVYFYRYQTASGVSAGRWVKR